jgi:hypothetical protein
MIMELQQLDNFITLVSILKDDFEGIWKQASEEDILIFYCRHTLLFCIKFV